MPHCLHGYSNLHTSIWKPTALLYIHIYTSLIYVSVHDGTALNMPCWVCPLKRDNNYISIVPIVGRLLLASIRPTRRPTHTAPLRSFLQSLFVQVSMCQQRMMTKSLVFGAGCCSYRHSPAGPQRKPRHLCGSLTNDGAPQIHT